MQIAARDGVNGEHPEVEPFSWTLWKAARVLGPNSGETLPPDVLE